MMSLCNQKRWSTLLEYGLAIFLVALATGLRLLLEPYMGLTVPYVTFFLSNALVIRFTGLGPSLLAILLSTFSADFFFLEPRYTLWSPPAQYLTSAIFVLANVIILALARAMRKAKDHAEDNARRMNRSQEIAHLGSWELDLLTNRLSWSDEVYRIFGLRPQEFGATYEAFLAAVHPEDREKVDAAYSGSVREGRNSYEIEHRIIRKGTGEVRLVHERCEHLRDASGRIIRSVGMVQDITERKATEEQLRLQASALEASANAMVITDRAGAIQWVNPAFERLTGYSAAEAAGQNPRMFKSMKQEPAFYQQMWQQIGSGRIWHGELVNKRKDGSLYPEEMTITPVKDARGQITHFIAIKQDISKRKRAEEALRESEERLRAMFDHAGVGIVEADANDRFIAANGQACQVLGYQREELLGMSVRQLTAPEDRALSDRLNLELHQGRRERVDYEKRYRKRDGTSLWVHVTVSPIRDPRGNWRRAIATIEDISERKMAEDALRQAKANLQNLVENLEKTVAERTARLTEMVGELEHFSYTLTHDLRAPLRAMSGFAQMIRAQGAAHPGSTDLLERITTAANRMDLMIREALDYSRAMSSHPELLPVDPGAILRDMLATYPNLQPMHADIALAGPFPLVLANESALTQCFSNLLGNAVKFVPPGRRPKIRIWAQPMKNAECKMQNADTAANLPVPQLSTLNSQPSSQPSTLNPQLIRLWFEDNGIGIAREDQAKIFGLFHRATTDFEGTGIGLALVRKNAERMGGKVGVESEKGKGSRFWLELRMAP